MSYFSEVLLLIRQWQEQLSSEYIIQIFTAIKVRYVTINCYAEGPQADRTKTGTTPWDPWRILLVFWCGEEVDPLCPPVARPWPSPTGMKEPCLLLCSLKLLGVQSKLCLLDVLQDPVENVAGSPCTGNWYTPGEGGPTGSVFSGPLLSGTCLYPLQRSRVVMKLTFPIFSGRLKMDGIG